MTHRMAFVWLVTFTALLVPMVIGRGPGGALRPGQWGLEEGVTSGRKLAIQVA